MAQKSLDTAFSGVKRASSGFCATLYMPIYENNKEINGCVVGAPDSVGNAASKFGENFFFT